MSKYAEAAHALAEEIASSDMSIKDKFGEMTVCASALIGAAAATMARIAQQKDGPELDVAGWSREITNAIVESIAKERH